MQIILIILVALLIVLQLRSMYKFTKAIQGQNAVNSARYEAIQQRFSVIQEAIGKSNANIIRCVQCIQVTNNLIKSFKVSSVNNGIELNFVRAYMVRRHHPIVNTTEIQDFIEKQ